MSLSEKIYELFVETNDIFRYIKGARIKPVSEERGSTVHFNLEILVLTLIRRLMCAGALPCKQLFIVTNMSWNLRGIYTCAALVSLTYDK